MKYFLEKSVILLFIIVLSVSVQGQTPHITKDINPGTETAMNINFKFACLDGKVFFPAMDGVHGRELWASDGTEEGTYMVKDINPGEADAIQFHGDAIVYNERVLFIADDGELGHELWSTDGSEEGTYMIKDINPGFGGSVTSQSFFKFNELLYFIAFNGEYFTELWVTDGTDEGTHLVKDINPSAGGSAFPVTYQKNFTVLGDYFYFNAFVSPGEGNEFWRSDGTEEGTTLVKDIYPGTMSGMYGGQNRIKKFNDALYFYADHPTYGLEIWKSDGTPEGTELLADINPDGDGYSSYGSIFHTKGDLFFFGADNGTDGREPWVSDGTTEGTRMLKNMMPSGDGLATSPEYFNFEGETYFFADSPSIGVELWKTDGTEVGTILVKDVNPGSENGVSGWPFLFDNKLFFFGWSSDGGRDLWSTDGTTENTVRLKDMSPEPGFGLDGNPLIVVNDDLLYFEATNSVDGIELWVTDGTEEGTSMMVDASPGSASGTIMQYEALCSKLFYVCNTIDEGQELWVLETGTIVSVPEIGDIEPSKLNIFPNPSNGSFTIDFEPKGDKFKVEVHNSIGGLVYTNELIGNGLFSVSIPNARGLYHVTITDEITSYHKKIIVVN